MALSTFATAFDRASTDLIALTQAASFIRNSSGDLTYMALDHMQNCLRSAKISAIAALGEAQKRPNAAEAQMTAVGGPETIVDFQTALSNIEMKAANWNTTLADALATILNADLIGMVVYDQDGVATKHIQFKHFIPAEVADPLRQSQALADLASALQTLTE